MAIIVGRLGRDPELTYTRTGWPIVSLSIATDESYIGNNGERVSRAEWHRVKVWEKQAENCARYLHKGSRCAVTGRLQTTKWEDRGGVTHYTTEVIASRVEFLSSRMDEQESQEEQHAQHQDTAASATSGEVAVDNVPF